uniref:hypothetical protein n=1 Tax=Enterococcus viikkiensis TaxID=930854 RepID=UPI0010F9D308
MKKRNIFIRLLPVTMVCFPLFGFTYPENETTTNDTQTALRSISTTESEKERPIDRSIEHSESSFSTTETTNTLEQATSSTVPTAEAQDSSVKERAVSEKFFVSITDKNYTLLKEPNGTTVNDQKENFQKTFIAEKVIGNDGIDYYFLATPAVDLGYIRATSAEKTNDQKGKLFLEGSSYANVIYNNAKLYTPDFQEKGTADALNDQTLKIVGFYNHYNGTKFHLLKNSANQLVGIIEAKAIQQTTSPGGKWNSTDQYITVTKNNWTIWKDFNFNNGSSTKNLYQHTYRVTGWY